LARGVAIGDWKKVYVFSCYIGDVEMKDYQLNTEIDIEFIISV
jgi:hypothetical protein